MQRIRSPRPTRCSVPSRTRRPRCRSAPATKRWSRSSPPRVKCRGPFAGSRPATRTCGFGTGNPPARPRTSGPTSTYVHPAGVPHRGERPVDHGGERDPLRRAVRARPRRCRLRRVRAHAGSRRAASPTPRRCFPNRPRGTDTPTTRRVRSSPARSTAGSGPRPTVPRRSRRSSAS